MLTHQHVGDANALSQQHVDERLLRLRRGLLACRPWNCSASSSPSDRRSETPPLIKTTHVRATEVGPVDPRAIELRDRHSSS
jgi:hypothetical protein